MNAEEDKMNALVVYDSQFGNTEKIARAIAGGLGATRVVRIGDASAAMLAGVDLVVMGSPTVAWKPTPAVTAFVDGLAGNALQGVAAATFDTRVRSRFGRLGGLAGPKLAAALTAHGAHVVLPAEGFFVAGKEGPLAEGELERATAWGQALLRTHAEHH